MQQRPATSFADDLESLRQETHGHDEPRDDFAADLDAVRAGATSAPEDKRSTFARGVDVARTPLLPQFAEAGRRASSTVTDPRLSGGLGDTLAMASMPTFLQGIISPAQARGFIGGALEGVGDVASGMTSPLDIVLMLTGAKALREGGRGVGAISRGVNALGSAALAARGAERVAKAESLPEAGIGLLETAGGAAGLHATAQPPRVPEPAPPVRIRGRLQAAPISVLPTGEAVLPGNAIPMQRTPDGSFVRGVPAQYPQKIVRALLPPGPQFVADDAGLVANIADAGRAPFAGRLPVLDEPTITPGRSGVRSSPARVMDREFEGARVTNEHFTSDPTVTADAPKVQITSDEAAELRRMLAEMQNVPFTRKTFNPIEVGHGGDFDVVGGAAGAPIFHAITQGRGGTRADVMEDIAGMLEGRHSANGQRALELARAELGYNPKGLERPVRVLPPEAGDLPQSGNMTDEDFTEFDRFVDRLSSEGGGDFSDLGRQGEEGFSNPELLARLGGTVAGGVIGGATGDTWDERLRRGAAGALAGGLLASAAGVGRGPRIRPIAPAAGVLEGLDARQSNIGPTSPNRPAFPDPREQAYGRVVDRLGMGHEMPESFPTSTRQPGAPRQPHADPLAGTDVFLDKFPEEVRGGIRQILEDNAGFDAQRRGVVDPAVTARLAEGVAVDASRALKPGAALNAQGVRAHADALAGAQSKINTLAQKVSTGAATDADVLALETARAEAKTIAASIMGARSEAGRALAEFRVLARVVEHGTPQQIQQAAETLRGSAGQFAQEFAALPDDPLTRYRWLQQRERPTFTDRARSYFYANILSGAKTHERNIIGNASNAVLGLVSQPFAAAADFARSTVRGVPRTVEFSELPHQVAGALVGVPQGLRDMVYAFRHGVTRAQLSGAMTAAQAGKLDLPVVEFGGGGANPFNWPMRGLNGVDQFFRSIGKNQELYALAFQQAKREGLHGPALQDRMAHLVTGVDEVSQGIQDRADAFARRAVFQEQGGPIVSSLQAVAARVPGFGFVVPFIKTPGNIMRQGFEASPAGFAMSAARQGGREGAQAMGRAAAGSAALGYFAYLAASGRLSGSGPTNPAERAQLMESGWRPNSVKIGNRWVSYLPMQPISTPAAAVADSFDAWRAAGGDADTAEKAADAVLRTVRSQLNQSFLSGAADLIQAIEQSDSFEQRAASVAARTAGGFVPFSGALGTVTSATDPMVRQPKGVGESMAARLPGLSQNVPARLDRFGRDVQREGGPMRRALDPFNVSTESDDPVLAELGRLGVSMGMPSGRVTLPDNITPLSRGESREVQQAKGGATYDVLMRVISAPGYANLSDDQKVDVLELAITRARGAVGQQQKAVRLRGRVLASPR